MGKNNSGTNKEDHYVNLDHSVNRKVQHSQHESPVHVLTEDEINRNPFLRRLPESVKPYLAQSRGGNIHTEEHSKSKKLIRALITAGISLIFFPYTIAKHVLVRQGELGLTWNGSQAEILAPGRHVLLSPSNRLVKVVHTNEPLIQHGPLTIVRVGEGQLAFGVDTDNGRPVFLAPGRHIIDSQTFHYERMLNFPTNAEEASSLNFINDRMIVGQFQFICVPIGTVGLVRTENGFEKLDSGIHFIAPPNLYFGNLSTRQKIIELAAANYRTKDNIEVNVKADIYYRVTDPLKAMQSIADIDRAVKDTAVAQLATIISEQPLMTTQLSSKPGTAISQGQGSSMGYSPQASAPPADYSTPSAPPLEQFSFNMSGLYNTIHDKYVHELSDYTKEHWGVDIESIRIEKLALTSKPLQDAFDEQATSYAKTTAQLQRGAQERMIEKNAAETAALKMEIDAHAKKLQTTIEADSHIATAEREQRVSQIQAETEANKQKIAAKAAAEAAAAKKEVDAMADAKRMKIDAQAKQEAALLEAETRLKVAEQEKQTLQVKTEAETNALRTTAAAKKEARTLEAEAEASYYTKVGATELGSYVVKTNAQTAFQAAATSGGAKREVYVLDPEMIPKNSLLSRVGLFGNGQNNLPITIANDAEIETDEKQTLLNKKP